MSDYNPVVGDTVFLLPRGNRARHGEVPELIETKIQRVGSKYFTVEHSSYGARRDGVKFRLSDFGHENGGYSSDYEFFSDRVKYEQKKERNGLIESFGAIFDWPSRGKILTLEQLRAMKSIVAKEKNE